MNDINEAIGLLREEVEKYEDVEQHAASFLTNIFLDTYNHVGDEDDPTPSFINGMPLESIQKVVLIIAGCALAFQQAAEESYEEQVEEEKEEGGMAPLDKAKWESYLDGVITLTSGLMGLALNVSDSATAEGELTVEDILKGGDQNGE
jgi:hypothetical protein